MKAFWKEDLGFLIFIGILLLLGVTAFILGSLRVNLKLDLCISAGYAGWEHMRGLRTDVCYGTLLEDGTFVIVPIETVRLELEKGR